MKIKKWLNDLKKKYSEGFELRDKTLGVIGFGIFFLIGNMLYYGKVFVKGNIITYLVNLSMFQFYFNIKDLDGSYWTMIIEMLFYLVILLLFYLKQLKNVLIIGISFSIVLAILSQWFNDIQYVRFCFNRFPFFKYLPLFLAGISFYKLHSKTGQVLFHQFIILICLLFQTLLYNTTRRVNLGLNQFEYFLILSLFFLLFWLFLYGKLGFIVNSVTLFLGKISYALYLIHEAVTQKVLIKD